MQFPEIKTKTLSGQKLTIPAELGPQMTLLILVFEDGGKYEEPHSQATKWLQLYDTKLKNKGIDCYELPMMSGKYRLMSFIIDSGMRSGIPPEKHNKVASFYGDKKKYMEELGIYDLRRAYVYLLDENGEIVFAANGEPKDSHLSEVLSKLERL